MKCIKKAFALILAACMLIGMPLSIDVSAADNADLSVIAFALPESIATATGVDPDHTILLSFNKDVSIDLSKTDVAVGFVKTTTGEAAGAKYFGNTSANQNSIQATTHTTLVKSEVFGETNNYIVTLANDYPLSDIVTEFGTRTSPWAIVVRLFDEATASGTARNNVVDGVKVDGATLAAKTGTRKYCGVNGNIRGNDSTYLGESSNTNDYYDIPLIYADSAMGLKNAEWTAEDKVEITFTQSIKTTADTLYSGMRIVNSKNEPVYYNPNGSDKYSTEKSEGAELLQLAVPLTDGADKTVVTVTEKSATATDGYPAGSVKNYSWFKEHLDDCQAEETEETFRIAYVLEDTAQKNWFINSLTAAASGCPMPATEYGSKAIFNVRSYADPLVLEEITFVDTRWVDMTFSEEVTLTGSGFGLAIVKDGKILENMYPGSWNGFKQGTTYSKTWRMALYNSNAYQYDSQKFITERYLGYWKAQGAGLYFYLRDAASNANNGLIDSVKTKSGKMLSNASFGQFPAQSQEHYYVSVEDKVFLKPTAYVGNDTTILVSYNGQYGGGWRNTTYLAAYDAQGNMLKINGADAKWKLTLMSDYKYTKTNATLNCAFYFGGSGTTYSGIEAQLKQAFPNGGYDLKMIVEDTGAKNGVLDNFRGYNVSTNQPGLYVRADELCSSSTKDVGVIPIGEIVTIDSVKIDESGKALITFSHDIDVDHFLSKLTDYSDFFLTISEKGKDSFVAAHVGTQTPIGSFKKFSDNQIIGYVNPSRYTTMMETYHAGKDANNWAIRMRIEMPTGWDSTTGELPLHKEIIPLDETVSSPYITQRNASQIWCDVDSCAELKSVGVKDWAATITGQNSFTFTWTKPVNMGDGYRGIRYVDENGNLLYYHADTDTVSTATNGQALQWTTVLEYANDAKTKVNGRLGGAGLYGVHDLADLLEPAADSEWGKIKAKYNGTFKLCMEEKGNAIQGYVETYQGADGSPIIEYPLRDAGWDGIYIDIKGEVIKGELSVVSVKAISDAVIEVTFSGPVEFLSNPYTALRFYQGSELVYYNTLTKEFTLATKQVNADGQLMYTDADGNPTTESASADGSVVYKQIDNMPMQWAATILNISKDKTVVRYVIGGRVGAPVNGITDLLAYDWEAAGGKLLFTYEENGDDARTFDQHINNIVRADDDRIALEGNLFNGRLDRARFEVEQVYTPVTITSKATVISDTQIRIDFSQPVNVDENTYMAVRMLNKKDMNLMWSGKANVSVAYQWPGTWEYANNAKTAIVWTINPSRSIWGAKNLYDLLNWAGPLVRYKSQGDFYFVMEEKNTADKPTGRLNQLVETVASLDGTNHLVGNGGTGYDNRYMTLNAKPLSGEELKLESVTAVDEHTLKVKFNRPVAFKEGDEKVSMAIRYLTESGDSETLTDGKTAIFKGDWKYDENDKSVVIWTLNSKHTDSLTELLTYSGKFKWNSSARCAFVITDTNADYYCPYRSLRINGITDQSGVHHLVANYSTDEYMMAQMDITVGYELPTVTIEPEQKIEYYTDYMTYTLVSAGLALAFVAAAVVVVVTKKKER